MSSIQHSSHVIADDVALGVRALHEADLAARAREEEVARLSRPTSEERREITALREAVAEGGLDVHRLGRLREIATRKQRRVQDALFREASLQVSYLQSLRESAEPAPVDPTFWWARTDWYASARRPPRPDEGSSAAFQIGFDDDGLQFHGGVYTHDGDHYRDAFGAVALFELQPERIPAAPSGLWRSTPHVELFGGLYGYTGDDDISTGDLWAKCWLHRSQQIFQMGFGEHGPAPIVLGQSTETDALIDEEDMDRLVRAGLPGFRWMPPVTFGGVNLASSLWARVEVRFDIWTEGAGSHVAIDPRVLLRTFQWPLAAL